MKKIALFYIVIMVLVFGSVSFAYAVDLKLPSFTTASSSIAGMISQIYIYALSIAGILAIVMIIYGGISYALDPGNASKQGEAKEIMQSAVWGIVLLAGAYVILKTINPDLVALRDLPLENIGNLSTLDITSPDTGTTDPGTSPGGTTIGCTVNNTNVTTLAGIASELLALNPEFSGNTSCPKESLPKQNVQDVANGKKPRVCNDLSCGCAEGGTNGDVTLCPDLLNALKSAQTQAKAGAIPNFRITSLTGDTHSSGSTHYQGRGADVTVNGNTAGWFNALKEFSKYGSASLEYHDASKQTKFIKISGTSSDSVTIVSSPDGLTPAWCNGCSNQHIHMNFGGAGTPTSDINDQYGNALRTELAQLASAYLSMQPNLLSNGSYGIPAGKTENTCSKFPLASPWNVMNRVLNKQFPYVCDQSKVMLDAQVPDAYCSCSEGGTSGKTTLNKNVFRYLGDLQSMVGGTTNLPAFQVVALTGGIQKEGASSYYSGTGVAITPTTYTKANLQKLFNTAKSLGYSDATYQAFKVGVTLPSQYNTTYLYSFSTISSKDVDDVSDCKTQLDPNKILNDYKNVLTSTCYFGRIYVTAFDN